MYNITTEQILKTKAPKQAAVFKTVMILACILAVTTIPSTYALGILLTAIFVVFTVILFKYYNAEYASVTRLRAFLESNGDSVVVFFQKYQQFFCIRQDLKQF